MTAIFAEAAYTGSGWQRQVRIRIADGFIRSVESGAAKQAYDVAVDTLLPAPANLHSHSFQRAMAGMSERRVAGKDSFWTWRELMYRFVETLNPDQVEAIAALTFMEMLEAGFSAVGEFHYLHHPADGGRYGDPIEMSARIFAAAEQTGIGLTHLPVLYRFGGAERQALSAYQQRFAHDLERYARLVTDTRNLAAKSMPKDTCVGLAPHSLRAIAPEDIAAIAPLQQQTPIHIHIAEQPQEVSEITAWLGARPVAWLLDHAEVDQHWCLVHATHMTDAETEALAQSGATAGLCPITEANLGDGPFNGAKFLAAGGRFGIGSDSNIRISLTEELRLLEYSQRLRDLARNILCDDDTSVGQTLYLGACQGGAQGLCRRSGKIDPGYLGDLVAIDTSQPHLVALRRDQLFDGFVFAASDQVVQEVWSAGRHVVTAGQHKDRAAIRRHFRQAMKSLMDRC